MEVISRINVTDVVYLYFQKAFDAIPHKMLMVKHMAHKWGHPKLDHCFPKWAYSQRVIVNGIASRKEAVLSGVPQGSILGLLLFVLYINDLPDTLVCLYMVFADDTKSFREITDVADMNMLQNDLYQMDYKPIIIHPILLTKCLVYKLIT